MFDYSILNNFLVVYVNYILQKEYIQCEVKHTIDQVYGFKSY